MVAQCLVPQRFDCNSLFFSLLYHGFFASVNSWSKCFAFAVFQRILGNFFVKMFRRYVLQKSHKST
nr:MAG TPA: hypothetical protein [Caudoviricetes sp.]